jgi:hypothetical protein
MNMDIERITEAFCDATGNVQAALLNSIAAEFASWSPAIEGIQTIALAANLDAAGARFIERIYSELKEIEVER